MNVLISVAILGCVVTASCGYPYYPYYYGGNYDTLSYGASDSQQGGMVLSRYYNPYYGSPTLGGSMAAFMYRQPEEQKHQQQAAQPSQYYLPDRRRQTAPDANLLPPTQNNLYTPQQNEVYPQQPEKPFATELTDIAGPTEKTEILSTTPRFIATSPTPEIIEPETEEVEEPEQKPRKKVSNKKQVKRPVDDDDEEEYAPKMPQGASYFPMFFGWGGRSSNGAPGGATAIANAYSTGRGGVATSHATAYGPPGPDSKYFKNLNPGNK